MILTMELAKNYEVSFQVIDYSVQERDRKTVNDMGRANMSSRVIPFDSYVTQPFYALGPLYLTKWDTELGSDRVVADWYGAANPIASNDTTEGRAQNRRVEVAIGGM